MCKRFSEQKIGWILITFYLSTFLRKFAGQDFSLAYKWNKQLLFVLCIIGDIFSTTSLCKINVDLVVKICYNDRTILFLYESC